MICRDGLNIYIYNRDFSIQLLGNPYWKLFQFIFQTETLFLLLDRVSYCRRGHSITTFYKTHLSTSSIRRFLFWTNPNNLSFLFNLPSTVGVKMLRCGDNWGKHIIDETQSLNRISKQNKNLPNCLQIRWKVENMTCVTWRLVRLRYQIFPEDKKHFGDTQWPL